MIVMPRRSPTTNQEQRRSRVTVQDQNLPLFEEEQTVIHGNNAASFSGLPEGYEDLIVKKVAKEMAKKIDVVLVLIVLFFCFCFFYGFCIRERVVRCYQLQFQIPGWWSLKMNAQHCYANF